jgi:hypothetical protein
LVPKLTKIHASFAQHIKADCEVTFFWKQLNFK